MKVIVTYKDPDRTFYKVNENGNEEELHPVPDDIWGLVGEYLDIEIDTETKEIKIV